MCQALMYQLKPLLERDWQSYSFPDAKLQIRLLQCNICGAAFGYYTQKRQLDQTTAATNWDQSVQTHLTGS